jgi:archaellum component FlaC
MVERWNGIIDVGMQSMVEPVEEEIEEVKEEVEEVPKECLIFKKIDESQIAFERYLQKLMRKNQISSPDEQLPKGEKVFLR